MKTFRLHGKVTTYCHLDVQAQTLEEAHDLGEKADAGDFITEDEGGQWEIWLTEEQKIEGKLYTPDLVAFLQLETNCHIGDIEGFANNHMETSKSLEDNLRLFRQWYMDGISTIIGTS